jgi:hypothetical protein
MVATCSPSRTEPRPTEQSHRVLLLALLTYLVVGCGRHRADTSPETGSIGEIALVVENHHWSDVVVSVVHDGVAERVGVATAVKTSTFIVQSRRLGTSGLLQLRGRAVGGPSTHTTESFLVRPGQEIQWTLESDLASSSVAVH